MSDETLKQDIVRDLDRLPPEALHEVRDFIDSLRHKSSSSAPSIEEKIEAHLANVPEEALNELPEDASENLDHYLYGAPKK